MTIKSTFVKFTVEELDRMELESPSETRSDAPEGPPLGSEFWKNARVVWPEGKTPVHLCIDSDVFDWFCQQSHSYQTQMNTVLRSFYEAHRDGKASG